MTRLTMPSTGLRDATGITGSTITRSSARSSAASKSLLTSAGAKRSNSRSSSRSKPGGYSPAARRARTSASISAASLWNVDVVVGVVVGHYPSLRHRPSQHCIAGYIRRRGRRAARVLAPTRTRPISSDCSRRCATGSSNAAARVRIRPALEAELDGAFRAADRRPSGRRRRSSSPSSTRRSTELEHFEFRRDAISVASRLPGGSACTGPSRRASSRQIQGVFEQTQDQSQRVAPHGRAHGDAPRTCSPTRTTHRVIQQLDDLQVAARRGAGAGCRSCSYSVAEVAARVPGAGLDAWYESDAFNAHFRGPPDDITEPLSRPRGALRRVRPGARHRLRARRVPRAVARLRRRRAAASRPIRGSSNGRARADSGPRSVARSSTCAGSTTRASVAS